MRHLTIPNYIKKHDQPRSVLEQRMKLINQNIKKIYSDYPEISIVIPAYNEAENILKTIASLADTTTSKKVEVIVVDNNSSDDTGKLISLSGVTCVLETQQGITPARNAGLRAAKGIYILNADADTIYPPEWIDMMSKPLYQENIAITYGIFSFLPTVGTSRSVFLVYEYISDISKWISKVFKEEAVNIYGFNSGFRRLEGIQVDYFNHPVGTNEDGWLGVKLRTKFEKKLFRVSHPNATVWTTDRRIQIDGGLFAGFYKRLRRHLGVNSIKAKN